MHTSNKHTSALVIDSNQTSRSVLVSHLREFGIGTVRHTGKVRDGRDMLERQPFDIVLCDYHFEQSDQTGQDLLDELRREHLLPYSTVFVMVTGEASYSRVTEAAEAALDSYLLKPYTGTALYERLNEARRRKRVLKPIFEAIEGSDFPGAAALCTARFEARAEYWLYAARVGAELQMRLNRPEAARALYDAVAATRALPWARLGIARSQAAVGDLATARRTLGELITELPQHAEAYDVLGSVQMEQGDLAGALGTYRQATALTPDSVTRLQHTGTLAFFGGNADEALRALSQACVVGLRSKLFDPFVLILLTVLRYDARDGKGLAQAQAQLLQLQERQPKSIPIARYGRMAAAFMMLRERDFQDATEAAIALTGEAGHPGFDLHAGCVLIALLARLEPNATDREPLDDGARRVASRFCVSHAACEMLVASATASSNTATMTRDCHAQIAAVAEKAMGYTLKGNPRRAVVSLLEHGSVSLNSKLIDMAGLVAQRHRERIENVEELATQAADLRQRYCAGSGSGTGARQGEHQRAPGGLRLRT